MDGALSMLEQAIRRDGDYFPAHYAYVELTDHAGRTDRRMRFYEGLPGPTSLRDCVLALARHRGSDGTLTVQRFERITADRSRGCIKGATAVFQAAGESAEVASNRTALVKDLSEQYPESFELRALYAGRLLNAGDTVRSDSVYRSLLRSPIPLWIRPDLVRSRAAILRSRNDTAESDLLVTEITRLKDHPKAGVRAAAARALWAIWEKRSSFEAALDSIRTFASLAQAGRNGRPNYVAFLIYSGGAGPLNDRGDFRSALILLDSASAIADRDGSPYLVLRARLYRGRTLRSLGRAQDAIVDLERAIRAGRETGAHHLTADAFHQLAHSYETLADWPRAVAAADSFVTRAEALRDPGMGMIRFHDAGVIRWKAGWHAAADEAFRRMVASIDSVDDHHSYAGKYYEQQGDLARALHYYRRAVDNDLAERELGLGGLARVYELTGQLDSALEAARRHDAIAHMPADLLLPRLLARTGQPERAIKIARRWAAIQIERGNSPAAARTLTELADMRPHVAGSDALALARAAAQYARRVNATRELIAARRTVASITAEQGSTEAALDEFRSLLGFLRTHPDPLEELRTITAIAQTYSRANDWRNALAWFDSAALRAANLEGRAGDAVLAARFRSARLDVFDGAYAAALAAPTGRRIPLLLAWSDRKKILGHTAAVSATGEPLPRDIAVADFINVRDTLWAVVTTESEQNLLRLPISGTTTARLSQGLVRPFRTVAAGNVDLARAPFDFARARELYEGLLRPIESLAPRATRLVLVLDAPLQAVPFDALVRASPRSGATYSTAVYAADRWNLSFATTYSAALRSAAYQRPVRGSLLLVTADAPGVERENAGIGRAWRNITVAAPQLPKDSLSRSISSGFSIVHFATHAVSNDRDPLASHLRLRPGSPDGLLHANEIPELTGGPIVVLSACETAGGEILHGAGVLSLARAFLARGASAAVATQWPIGEKAAELSEYFYIQLARGEPPARALYLAKRRLRSDPETSHPFFWASHILLTR